MSLRLARVAAALLLAATACANAKRSEAATPAARVIVETAAGARVPVRVEVARTEEARARGLMFRKHLDDDAGMLFLFDTEERHVFWMKNTPLPLDMIFADEDGRIVAMIERAAPETITARDPGVPSRYVLEVNGGWAAAHGVRIGDRLRFEGVPRF
jgi:uncharacterized protein